GVDALRHRLRRRFNLLRPHVIIPFRGYGSQDHLFIRGRVLEERGYHHSPEPGSVSRQLRFMYQRFQSDEIPGASVWADYAGARAETKSDEEGFFNAILRPRAMLPPDRIWHEIRLSLVENGRPASETVARVVVPPIEAAFGVISDIDDTIIRTSATN